MTGPHMPLTAGKLASARRYLRCFGLDALKARQHDARTHAKELARDLEELSEDGGCCLHIAIEDFNVSDEHLDACKRYAEERDHTECAELAARFKALIPEDRREAFLGVLCDDTRVHPITPWRPE